MNTPNYSAAMWLLYATGRLLVNNCKNKLTDFAAFSAAYTQQMLDDLLKAIDDAEAIPDEEARAQEHSQLLEELKPLFKTCQKRFMLLKRYISFAFPKNLWEINWNSAGWDMYDTEMNWSEARNMYAKALLYISNNKAALLANENMPANFEADFLAAVNLFNVKLENFNNAKVLAVEGTDEKVAANNAVYAKIIERICEVGQVIFSDDDTKRGEFSFEKMSEILRPNGPAGLKGVVKIGGVPQAGLTVELENGDKTVITNGQGEFDFGNKLASGKDTIIVKQGDEVLAEEEVTIPPGVTKHEDVEIAAPVG